MDENSEVITVGTDNLEQPEQERQAGRTEEEIDQSANSHQDISLDPPGSPQTDQRKVFTLSRYIFLV